MKPANRYVQVKPVKQGMISSDDGNEYEIVSIHDYSEYDIGDIVIVPESSIVEVNVSGEGTFFIREEEILARANRPGEDYPDGAGGPSEA